jgi:hypothetical protein
VAVKISNTVATLIGITLPLCATACRPDQLPRSNPARLQADAIVLASDLTTPIAHLPIASYTWSAEFKDGTRYLAIFTSSKAPLTTDENGHLRLDASNPDLRVENWICTSLDASGSCAEYAEAASLIDPGQIDLRSVGKAGGMIEYPFRGAKALAAGAPQPRKPLLRKFRNVWIQSQSFRSELRDYEADQSKALAALPESSPRASVQAPRADGTLAEVKAVPYADFASIRSDARKMALIEKTLTHFGGDR